MKKFKRCRWMCCFLLAALFHSCKKGEYIETHKAFVDVHFDARQTALQNNGEGIYIAAKYNGQPIDWDPYQFKIKVVEGEGRFEFYDTRSGETVVEKVVDVKPGMTDTFTLFQPLMESPISFIDPKAYANEPAAPAGHIKIKIANYAQMLIPFDKVNMKISLSYWDGMEMHTSPIGTIEGLTDGLDDAVWHVLPNGVPEGITEYAYEFQIIDGNTGQALANHGGTAYAAALMSPVWMYPLPEKNVFVLYLVPFKAWGETPFFIKHGEEYYDILGNILAYY